MAGKRAKAAPASAGPVEAQEHVDGGAQEQGGDSDDAALGGAQEQGDADSGAVVLANSSVEHPMGRSDDGAGLVVEGQGAPQPDADTSWAPQFPMRVTIFNHSSASISCRVAGAVLGAGGSATVTLIDEEHAEIVQKSLEELAESNFIPLEKLAVVPA